MVERIQDEGQTLRTPTGKVLGIVDDRATFDGAAHALKSAGFSSIQALVGDDGVQLLERVDKFFFSDMEDRVVRRHLEELQAGHIIIAIETPSNRVDEVTAIAAEHGVRGLVHFGMVAVTWLTR